MTRPDPLHLAVVLLVPPHLNHTKKTIQLFILYYSSVNIQLFTISLHVTGPQRQIIPKQLHNQRTILITLLR